MRQQVYSRKIFGVWYNQLGSKMTLIADKNGGLSGTYESAVGDVHGTYILTGRFDAHPPPGKGVSVGWAVTFRNNKLNAHSTATWSGQYFAGNDERILTQWLLTSSTTPKSVWNSTNVGHDTFTRIPPNAPPEIEALTVDSPPEDILSHFFHFNFSENPYTSSNFRDFAGVKNSGILHESNEILEVEEERNNL